jgi:hypothetical protein
MPPGTGHPFLDLPRIEQVLVYHHSPVLLGLTMGVQLASQLPDRFARVIQIDDLCRPGEMQLSLMPDPL